MHVHILGSGAGGGFPQWNCNCPNCAGQRAGRIPASARTQSSIAVSADDHDWVLINASPDVRTQINGFPPFHRTAAVRGSGIGAIILIDSQIDHAAGLLSLRESSTPLDIYCTEPVRQDLTTGFPVLKILEHYCGTRWHPIATDGTPFVVPPIERLRVTAVPLLSKAPPYSPHRHDPHPGDNIGLLIEDRQTDGKLFYAPGLARLEAHLEPYLRQADCLLVDGTMWTDDEMRAQGLGTKLASEMGHLAQSGPGGMIEGLRAMPAQRKILIHINNTNPILNEESEQRRILRREGIEVACDGMDLFV